MRNVRTIPLDAASPSQREMAAEILVAALSHTPSVWDNTDSARAEVRTFLDSPDRLGFSAIDGDRLVGWIGAIRHCPTAWELHPLVVAPDLQRHGYGTLLLETLERAASDAGVCTIWLGTDDDFGGTNLFGIGLYPDVLRKLAGLAPTTGHPFTFYRVRGYTVVGVLPDSGGPGRHDILMAKRIGPGR